MKVEILKTNPYIEGWGLAPEFTEVDGKKIFELTMDEYADFATNSRFYKIKTKKLFFDEVQKAKVLKEEEGKQNAQKVFNFKTELCNLKEQLEKFQKHKIVTEELENKIIGLENKIKNLTGEPYIKVEETEGANE